MSDDRLLPRPGRAAPALAALWLVLAGAGSLPATAAPGGEAIAERADAPARGELAPAPVERLGRSWRESQAELPTRARGVREQALRMGVANLDPAARALLLDEALGPRSERTRAAAELAPDLPAAQAAWAQALLVEERSPFAAGKAALRSIRTLFTHLEASLWLAAVGSLLAVWVALAVGTVFIAFCALPVLRSAAHDLGDVVERSMPSFGRAALLIALLLLPLAFGEGALGIVLSVFAIAFCYAARAQRAALLLAATGVIGALHPGLELSARALTALGSDVVAEAAFASEHGLDSPLIVDRLSWVGERDPLAARALALREKREGRYGSAAQRYERLLAVDPSHPRVLNNAANVELARGNADAAIALYERAIEESRSPWIWFNLAQAYGRSIRVEDHEFALAYAQSLDVELIRQLTRALASNEEGYVADLPIAPHEVWLRWIRTPRAREAAALRAPYAPGRLGQSGRNAALAFGIAALVALLLRTGFEPSRRCSQCGGQICPRCPSKPATQALCQPCARLLHRPETTDPTLRTRRLEGMRRRTRRTQRVQRALALLVPGAAGILLGRPLAALCALAAFALTLAAGWGPSLLFPDPLAAGGAGVLLFGALAVGSGLSYAAVTALTLLSGRA